MGMNFTFVDFINAYGLKNFIPFLCGSPPEEDLQPILREGVEIAVASLKKGKSVGVDNIPAELLQAGGETMIDVLTEICNRIWRTGEWPTPWTQSLIITLPKKGNLQLCQNYRTISLISHSSKVMLKVILNRLKPQAGEIIAEEQAGFRAGRSTTEQIFNLRILCEKYLQHQQSLYHVFIDFKKLMTNIANDTQREIKVKGQKLGTVTSFKYLGAVVSDDGSKPEVLSRIAQATAALTKLKPIWRDNNISLGSKVKLMRSLVISIFMYACESWTLTAALEKRTQAFEMRCYRRLLKFHIRTMLPMRRFAERSKQPLENMTNS